MSLDIDLIDESTGECVYDANITHNLCDMAKEAGIYYHLWRPEEIGVTHASQLIEPLKVGLMRLICEPDHFEKFSPSNGWGSYENFVSWVTQLLYYCVRHPAARIESCR